MFNTRTLVVGLVVCLGLLAVYSVTITILAFSGTKPKDECETFGCVKAAAQIVRYINESINPCNDFYQFANGRYLNEKTDEDYSLHSMYTVVTDIMNRKIGRLLAEPPNSGEPNSLRLAKSFYRSCKNVSISEEQKANVLQSLGGWPVVSGDSWSTRNFSLNGLMKKVNDLGFGTNFIFKLSVYGDPENKTKSFLGIDKVNFDDERNGEVYRQLMNAIPLSFTDANDEETKNRIAKEMDSVRTFEKLLHESDNNVDSGASEPFNYDQITTIRELQKSYPYFDWLKHINAVVPSGTKVTENDAIANLNPKFFERLDGILKKSPPRTITNYILWCVMFNIIKLEVEQSIKCDSNPYCCADLTSEKFAIPVTILYSLKYFNETSRQAAVSMVEDVRHAFIEMLRKATWMGNTARTKAIEKAENIISHVVYPNGMFDSSELEEYYRNLEMESDDFFLNSMRLNLFKQNQVFNALRKPASRSGWQAFSFIQPNKANAYYSIMDNTMNFPIAILHDLFFAVDRPQYINFASLGTIAGHEITHGFDIDGRWFDRNGNHANWWDTETVLNFIDNSFCFMQQYGNYKDEKTQLKIDGMQTLNENIADNSGVRAAYYAYQNWIDRNGPEELVPGIKYNQNQLFWISFAQALSGVYGTESLINRIINSEHAISEFRVIGVVSNTPEFAKDFNCAAGTKMNPTKKCKLW